MSKYETVRKALEGNPEVAIVDLQTKNFFPGRNGYFTQTADFWVAPTVGLYNADDLQEFMHGLVPGLKPTMKDAFHQFKNELSFGKLYFDEKIGEERAVTQVTHTMTDQEFTNTFDVSGDGLENVYGLNEKGVLVVDSDRTVEHRRRTWVRPFPTATFARDVLEGKVDGEYRTSVSNIKRYEPGVLQRAARLIGAVRQQ
jgi:hypothetical protein